MTPTATAETTELYDTCLASCRENFRAYLYATAPQPGEYRMDAPHLLAFCHELQAATEAVERGANYYAIITCPPQHWKSTTCSQHYPVWHLGRNPGHRIIQVSYSATIAERNSRFARRLVHHPVTREAFGISLDPKSHAVADWTLAHHDGGMLAAGFGGGITGNPGNVIVIDDYFKNREEAESPVIREKVWDSFRSDVWSRRAPAHAVLVIATRWHEDGLIGRIIRAMEDDPGFPQFKLLSFPAWTEDRGWLFTERFSPEFYAATKVAVGKYAWASLYMCNPTPREGGLLKVDNMDWRDAMPDGLRWVRFWDLASGEKERNKSDPDWSVGVKLAVTKDEADERILHVWIGDVVRVQSEAPARDRLIVRTAERDGSGVKVGIEQVGAYKDTVKWMRKLLRGKATVRGVKVTKDKVTRAEPLEPIFEASHVHVLRAAWNDAFVAELRSFPNGRHDDQVDGTSGGFGMAVRGSALMFGPLDMYATSARDIEAAALAERATHPGAHFREVDIAGGIEVPDETTEARQRIFDDDDAWS